jgi:hypothetical protein
LSPGDTSCSREYNETRLVDLFPRHVVGVGKYPPDEQLARTTAATAADVVARWWSMIGEEGVGLRGGTFTATGDTRVVFRLRDVRWVEDLSVRGRVVWERDTGAVRATLVARRPDGERARLTMGWNDWAPGGRALIVGTVDRRPVTLDIAAP